MPGLDDGADLDRHGLRVRRRQERLTELALAIATSSGKDLDDNDARELLRTIVRRWSLHLPVLWQTRAARRAVARGERVDVEHVVPVRVLVDRMIAKPRTTPRLLRSCILLAEVTPQEHQRLGRLVQHHPELYEELKRCRIDTLCELSWQRYIRRRVAVSDAAGRSPWT
jgi:hypothetical protein